jgi:hypothetical protein
MRKAYGGRAAAYERQGDYDRAAADYGMVVFSYAVELDIADPKADGYDDLVRNASKAYRTRAACLEAKGDKDAAGRDQRRAEKLEAKAKSAADKAQAADAPPATTASHVTLRNDWTDTLSIVIGGVSYTLRVGETRTVPSPTGSFPYEIQAGGNRAQGTLESGRSYSLAVHPPASP